MHATVTLTLALSHDGRGGFGVGRLICRSTVMGH